VGDLAVERARDDALVLRRSWEDERLWLAFNLGPEPRRLDAPSGSPEPFLSLDGARLDAGEVTLPGYSALFAKLAS